MDGSSLAWDAISEETMWGRLQPAPGFSPAASGLKPAAGLSLPHMQDHSHVQSLSPSVMRIIRFTGKRSKRCFSPLGHQTSKA